MNKQAIMSKLHAFVIQRPGLDYGNYGEVRSYRADSRKITCQLNDYFKLAYFVNTHSVELDLTVIASSGSRLHIDDKGVDYCVGQYWPMEYRAGVCRLLAFAIWAYFRECGYATGEDIRKAARNELGRSIANRWFK